MRSGNQMFEAWRLSMRDFERKYKLIDYDVKSPTHYQLNSIKCRLYDAIDHLAGEGLLSPEEGPYVDNWGVSRYSETWSA